MYCTYCGKNLGEQPVFCQYCGARVAPAVAPSYAPGAGAYVPPGTHVCPPQRRFYRSSADKKVAGVCAGVARYFDIDTTLVRALWLLCLLLGGTGGLAYIVLWIVMPLDPEYIGLPA